VSRKWKNSDSDQYVIMGKASSTQLSGIGGSKGGSGVNVVGGGGKGNELFVSEGNVGGCEVMLCMCVCGNRAGRAEGREREKERLCVLRGGRCGFEADDTTTTSGDGSDKAKRERATMPG